MFALCILVLLQLEKPICIAEVGNGKAVEKF